MATDNALDADWFSMGEGHIPSERVAEELRPIRHNLKLIKTAVNAQSDMVKMTAGWAKDALASANSANQEAARAFGLAQGNHDDIARLDHQIFGDTSRPDLPSFAKGVDERFSQMKDVLTAQSRQNRWIIGLLVVMIVGMLGFSGVAIQALHH